MSEVDFLVKLRDASAMVLDACETRLERLAPSSVKGYDPGKISWIRATGPHGPFEKATAEGTSQSEDFVLLLEDLKTHKGTMTRSGLFYWLFKEGPTTIGRKPAKK